MTMDLPCDDGSASFETYADVVCAALDGCGDDLVLVGHSLGGHTIPLVPARRPVGHLVYLCAAVPDIGRSLFDQLKDEPPPMNPDSRKGLERDGQKRRAWVDMDVARELLYADCDEQTVQAAFNRLRRRWITLRSIRCRFPNFRLCHVVTLFAPASRRPPSLVDVK